MQVVCVHLGTDGVEEGLEGGEDPGIRDVVMGEVVVGIWTEHLNCPYPFS